MGFKVEVGVSNKHIHLAQSDVEALFGKGHQLTPFKDLKQTGQYACEEKVDVVGPKGTLKGVRILGPARPESQIEVALTDGRTIGINAPIKESGQLEGTPGCKLVGPAGEVELTKGVIAALRHVHLSTKEAEEAGVKDKEYVSLKFEGPRAVTFDQVLIRVHESFLGEAHLDTDEANAGLIGNGQLGEIIK